ncbi:transcription-repair coupling factor [Aquirufa ecclesiirivi]|uniref:transcription-repair coupling factor n=1 Tax=Aquirufa ecclesiirivi TaxID=2715124 RepID=UPI00140D6A2A|nr:transcription-repair coupling factor [Aquirufa ecclesiirivi]NHC49449.1 transcription-repair coupling factor [Aquirufa ecclesiirivi]
MIVKDFIAQYQHDGIIQTLSSQIHHAQKGSKFHVKGLSGSLDAILMAATKQEKRPYLLICEEKEEAHYLLNDLQSLVGDAEVLLFPMSHKKPYEWEEIDNANVLMRAEVLNVLSNLSSKDTYIVTYPEALSEKVINRKSLVKNTLSIRVGDKIDPNFVAETLNEYDFERTDFVYEAGQYSVRGGILDVFSYATEFPYRLDFFGNEVDSIRTFHPETQLSIQSVSAMHLIPDVQTKLIQESRESFLSFFPENSIIWIKDQDMLLEIIQNYFQKTHDAFEELKSRGSDIQLMSDPSERWESKKEFLKSLNQFTQVEYGKRNHLKNAESITYASKNPGAFHKDFERLAGALLDNQTQGYQNIICSESSRQLERLEVIFNELNTSIQFKNLQITLREGFIDEQTKIAFYPDHQLFDRFHRFKEKNKFSKNKALTLKELRSLQVGDFVTHIDYGIGRFAGLNLIETSNGEQEVIRLIYRDDDVLSVSIHALHKISKYSGKEGAPPSMSKLGSPDWDNKKSRVKKQVKDIAKELISLYAKRKSAPGFSFSPDTYLQAELESSFLYEDTPDQAKATQDVKADMEKPHPMDRLVCGDVGFGKTEIAVRAAFKAVADSKQVAVLVPTTVLAMQHFRTFHDRLAAFPCKVEYINRFKSPKQIKETLDRVAKGVTDILIGTHRLVNKDVVFKNLGLMIIDEEQKFGVKVKDRLKEMRVDVDVLTLTATPIPRTLHFSLMGARDLSIIATPPPNRQPVETKLVVLNDELLRDGIREELSRNGQVFVVYNRIGELESIANRILRLVPDAKIAVAHGQMDGDKLEKIMLGFIEGHYDVLVATNIIESGLDIPNANTIFIINANNFGLSDLHQMRGRVGRSNKKAYCYLVTPSLANLTSDARKRLSALEEFSDLGDGIKVAMRDLDIRGAGNLLGAEQSGFINDLGYDMYHKILDEAVQELKENEFKALFEADLQEVAETLKVDCQIETDMRVLIPDTYVQSISERLALYTRLDEIDHEEDLNKFIQEVEDRFGKLPQEVSDMIELVKCRWKAQVLGIEKILLKNNILKLHFVSSETHQKHASSIVLKVINFVNTRKGQCQLREKANKLILQVDRISSIDELNTILVDILG